MPEPYILALAGASVLIALVAWLPLALKNLPLSLPIFCIAFGAAIFWLMPVPFQPMPMAHPEFVERFSEFVVIIALMGAGLKLDRVFDFRHWAVTWRLLAITMPLTIGAITLLGAWGLGLAWPVALLLGAALAPTDPVLASDVQVGPPRTGDEDEVRFGLTSEAGLNDGLAFPFIHLAIALSLASSQEPWLMEWLGYHVVWKIVGAIVVGWIVGWLVGWLAFRVPIKAKLSRTGDGLIAIGATLFSYAVAEILFTYGFLAVFTTALTLRHSHREHDFQREMHDVTEQIERLAMMVLLLLFGGALVSGLLAPLTFADVAVAFVILLIVRPLSGLAGLAGFQAHEKEKLTLAFFGIRGIGSIYYLAYGLNHMPVEEAERLWAIVGLVILLSILLHGLTVTPVMQSIDRLQEEKPAP